MIARRAHQKEVVTTAAVATPGSVRDACAHFEQRDDPHDRFPRADRAEPTRFADIPKDVVLCLLPEDDPVFVENEPAAGAEAVRRGKNVCFRYAHVADLPTAPSDGARPQPGGRSSTRTARFSDRTWWAQRALGARSSRRGPATRNCKREHDTAGRCKSRPLASF
jgi:hypothetical protein